MQRFRPLASLGIATAILTLGGAAMAQEKAECLEDLAEIESTHLGVLEHMSSFELKSLSTLRNAAQVLARNDREDTCEELVETIGDMLSERREKLVEAGLMVEVDDEQRLVQLKNAPHVQDMARPLTAGDLIGADLRNMQDQYLGEIEDVVFDPEGRQITHALVSVGGFLGLGEEVVAVPLSALRVTDNLSTYIVQMSQERFDQAPRLGSGELQQVQDSDWRDKNDMYYSISAND